LIVDRVSSFCAQHPDAVKGLGAAAITVALELFERQLWVAPGSDNSLLHVGAIPFRAEHSLDHQRSLIVDTDRSPRRGGRHARRKGQRGRNRLADDEDPQSSLTPSAGGDVICRAIRSALAKGNGPVSVVPGTSSITRALPAGDSSTA
jgi:hypothetical protein